MAVREALLASLIPGPGYGFQLHGALAVRTGGRRQVNVGQSYATLERAAKAKLIESAGATDDGLPLHRLTAVGRAAADAWLNGEDASGADPWDETVDRVLIAASLPGIDASSIASAEAQRWRERLAAAELDAGPTSVGAEPALASLARAADAARARAALHWLERAASAVASGPSLELVPSTERPRRGRRPSAAGRTADADAQPSAIA